MQIDTLKWWGTNKLRFPLLTSYAREVLAVRDSSVASESSFSGASSLLAVDRASLTDESFCSALHISEWFRELGK